MPSAVVSAVVLLLVLVQVQDAAGVSGAELRKTCNQNYRAERGCGRGWVRMNNNKCAKLFEQLKTFVAAKGYCVQVRGHLASIHDNEQYNYVMCLTIKTPKRSPTSNDWFWIGAQANQPGSGYSWTDGSGFHFTRWDSAKPDGRQDHNCVVMNHNKWGHWANVKCDQNRKFVCIK